MLQAMFMPPDMKMSPARTANYNKVSIIMVWYEFSWKFQNKLMDLSLAKLCYSHVQ